MGELLFEAITRLSTISLGAENRHSLTDEVVRADGRIENYETVREVVDSRENEQSLENEQERESLVHAVHFYAEYNTTEAGNIRLKEVLPAPESTPAADGLEHSGTFTPL